MKGICVLKNMSIEDVRKIKHELKKVKPKPKSQSHDRKLNLKEIIFELMPELVKMRNGGYSHAEIAEALGKSGITISPQTLSKYMSEYRKKAKVEAKAAATAPPPTGPAKQVEPQPTQLKPDFIKHNNTPNLEDFIHGT